MSSRNSVDLNTLSEQQLATLREFMEVVRSDSVEECVDALARSGWRTDAATDAYFSNRLGEEDESSSLLGGDASSRRPPSSRGDAAPPSAPRGRDGAGNSSTTAATTSSIAHYFRWLFQATPTSLDADGDARRFVSELRRAYCAPGTPPPPEFFEGSYVRAVAHAHQQQKFLLVYLHSPIHEDTQLFCSNFLCSPAVRQYLDENVVLWGGSVHQAEAYNLSNVLKAARFPFLALLACQSSRSVQLLERVQGAAGAAHADQDLLRRLQSAANRHRDALSRTSVNRVVRDEASQLRSEQDREYQEALENDRRLRAQREAQEAEQRRAEEEARQREELEAALKLSQEVASAARLDRARGILPPEPPASSSTANIRFQLPNGKRAARNFRKEDTVEVRNIFTRRVLPWLHP
jgi:FAS-associated factor 2